MIGKFRSRVSVSLALALLTATAACSLPMFQVQGNSVAAPASAGTQPSTQPPTQEPTGPVAHKQTPGELPLAFESQIHDPNSSALASQHRANAGENFGFDLYERPFDQSMNTYFPDLDIKNTALNRDAAWIYVTITLAGQDPQGGLLGDYGLELDVNRDGRGDFLIMAAAPKSSWSTDGVRVWQDSNHNVGSIHPVQSDAPQNGDGYETVLFDQGQGSDPDLAWARLSPKDPKSVQIAFKRSLFNDANPFLWGAWAMDPGILHPDWFDYNDHFTQAEAGSPLVELKQYYPLKALYEVDNTCRWAVGFTPNGSEPGICPVPPTPAPPAPPSSHKTPVPTATRPIP